MLLYFVLMTQPLLELVQPVVLQLRVLPRVVEEGVVWEVSLMDLLLAPRILKLVVQVSQGDVRELNPVPLCILNVG